MNGSTSGPYHGIEYGASERIAAKGPATAEVIAGALTSAHAALLAAATPRQREILDYIKLYQAIHMPSPTVREIGAAVGLASSSTIQNHLNALERKGLIRRQQGKTRSIELTGEST